jgi:hypothetical protein
MRHARWKSAAAKAAAAMTAAALLAAAPQPARAQFRNVGPGVADRTGTIARGGGDEVIFGGEFQSALELDVNGRQRPNSAYGNLFTESLLATYLLLPYGFVANGVFRLEQAPRDPDGTGSFFKDQTAWVDELNLTWSTQSLDVFGGKIHPRFGSAWDRGPGLFGTDFGREYELTEKIGVGARVWLSDFFSLYRTIGTHNLQVEFFQADRSALSYGAFTRRWAVSRTAIDPETGETIPVGSAFRWRNNRATGTPDNTDFAGGMVASLAGFGIPMPRGQAGYTLSYSQRQPGDDATLATRPATERAFTAGAFWTIPLPYRFTAAPFVEYARQYANAGGYGGNRSDWLTAGFDLRNTPWTVSYAFQQNGNKDPVEGNATRVEHSASVTYDLYFLVPAPILRPLSVTLGWRSLREAGVTQQGVGGLVGWSWKF